MSAPSAKVRCADGFRPRSRLGVRLAAAAASASLLSSGPLCGFSPSSSSTARAPWLPPRTSCYGSFKLDLAPPELGRPKVPELPMKVPELEPEPERPPVPPLPPSLQRMHMDAAKEVVKGFRLSLRRQTAIVPMGLGDGALGAQVIKGLAAKKQNFQALVLMPKVMLEEAMARYRAVAGAGLYVLRLESGDEGTDIAAKVIGSFASFVMVGAYEDAIHFVRAHRRMKAERLSLLVCEMAHAALAGDKAAYKAVLAWHDVYRVSVLQSLFISSRSLEQDPVRGLEEATMEVPGMPTYQVVARPGGPTGPQVFDVPLEKAQKMGVTVPLKLVVLPATGAGLLQGLASLQESLGIQRVEAIPESAGGGAAAAVEFLNQQVQNLTAGQCEVSPRQMGVVPDALLIAGNEPDPLYLLQAVGRLSFRVRQKRAGYLLILGGSGPAPTAAWRALSEHDARLRAALRQAAVDRGRLGGPLDWKDLQPALQDILADATGQDGKASQWLQAVNEAVLTAAESWDLMYGHLLAYRETMEDPTRPVPVNAQIHGVDIGKWVARQFLEWRSGTLSAEKQELLEQRGLDVEEEGARSFAEGLVEFETYVKDSGSSYVPSGYFSSSGFPLYAWATKQWADWRRGKLTAEQQYMLDEVGFPPVRHPDDPKAQEYTKTVEAVLRNGAQFPYGRRKHIFATLVRKWHPAVSRQVLPQATRGSDVLQFLAGYREWFLNPPPPPAAAQDVLDTLPGFEPPETESEP
ncbi:unnamed protein product [Effrenium voratum]|uniref:Helicase-associated domain-containing protein n=1 Tax=Effrenium voratum TaxID=2562239 RepID=A0AA36JAV9_9DINO|nr:unnamed protein product [Effrenium voratum]